MLHKFEGVHSIKDFKYVVSQSFDLSPAYLHYLSVSTMHLAGSQSEAGPLPSVCGVSQRMHRIKLARLVDPQYG